MAISRLSLYNNALILLGERQLTSEYENRPARKVLDEIYGQEAVGACLELARPKFAQVTAKLATPASSSVHGFDYVYDLPADFLCIVQDPRMPAGGGEVYTDDVLQNRVERYLLEGETIATEIATNVYIRYVSNLITMSQWTPTFADLVSAYLARVGANRIAPDKYERAEAAFKDRLGGVLELEWGKEVKPRPLKAIVTIDAHWLKVYNGALQLLGQPLITGTTDQSPARIAIDYLLNADFSGVFPCIERTRPRFAMNTVTLSSSTPGSGHGYTNVFSLPADYLNIIDLHSDSTLDQKLNRYFIDGGTIATNYASAYLRYLQNDAATSLWSQGFLRYVCAYIANELKTEFARGESGAEREATRKNITLALEERYNYVWETEAVKEPEHRPAAPAFVLTSDWLPIYNRALMAMELPPILAITDDSERRHALDMANVARVVNTALSDQIWNFACTRALLTYDATYTATFGYQYRVATPATMHRIAQLSPDEYLQTPADYAIEGGYIMSNYSRLYIRYVTTAMLTTPASWPQYFCDFIAGELALMCQWLPGVNKQNVRDQHKQWKLEAYATDKQRQPSGPIFPGSWVRSRGGSNWGIDNGRFRQR